MKIIFKKISSKFTGRQKIYLVFLSLIMFGTFAVSTNTVLAQKADSPFGSANPVVLIIVVGMLSLAPFALIMLTSFVKISVVLSLLRNAMGTQQAPPNQVITGISLILSIFIMAPVVERMYQDAGTKIIFEEVKVEALIDIAVKGKEPLREFLKRFSSDENRIMFRQLAVRMAQRNQVNNAEEITADDFRVIIPSFVTTELSKAFVIGFFIFIPFLVIDMIISNILQAMGMFMLSPTTISLPFKLLLFVMTDGWTVLIKNLVMGYL
jgi:type III secretion protein R